MNGSTQQALLSWYKQVKRDLPWRHTKEAYRIWLSEIMLQQTRSETVKGYYARFLEKFPTVQDLASAEEQEVLKAWEGLGYYSRARNLQKAAKLISEDFDGVFPCTYEQIAALPGIGPYTAGAIGSIAFGLPVPAIDGNVYRVAARFFGIRQDTGAPSVQKEIRRLITESLPADCPGDFNQALMELGATCCCPGKPRCGECPWQEECDACREGDAELLPIHEKKKAPKSISMAVSLLICKNNILVFRRKEKMLKGLSVFWLTEDASLPEEAAESIRNAGIEAEFVQGLGHARHVFTHRIWEMEIMLFSLCKAPEGQWLAEHDALLADGNLLASLPFPSAMRAAKEEALRCLNQPVSSVEAKKN